MTGRARLRLWLMVLGAGVSMVGPTFGLESVSPAQATRVLGAANVQGRNYECSAWMGCWCDGPLNGDCNVITLVLPDGFEVRTCLYNPMGTYQYCESDPSFDHVCVQHNCYRNDPMCGICNSKSIGDPAQVTLPDGTTMWECAGRCTNSAPCKVPAFVVSANCGY